jgi:hypothetical protein
MGKFRDFVARKLPATKVRRGSIPAVQPIQLQSAQEQAVELLLQFPRKPPFIARM